MKIYLGYMPVLVRSYHGKMNTIAKILLRYPWRVNPVTFNYGLKKNDFSPIQVKFVKSSNLSDDVLETDVVFID